MAGGDIIVWPDGTWCFRYELHEYTHMSDDYLVLPIDSIAADVWLDNHE